MMTVSASAMLLVLLSAVSCGISLAADQMTLVYYGTRTVDRLYLRLSQAGGVRGEF